MNLPDVQQQLIKSIPINRVGVKDIDFPMLVQVKGKGSVLTHAVVNIYSSLNYKTRGISMSRAPEVLMKYRYKAFSRTIVKRFLKELKRRMGAEEVYVELKFSYFANKKAPVSKKVSVMSYDCYFIGKLTNKSFRFLIGVTVPVASVCPCSKAISKYGAHNQRCLVTVTLESKKIVWFEDLIHLIEKQGSCDLYTVLKRPDEKFITESGYENAKFVEDIVRDVALKVQEIPGVNWFKVKVESFESIHNHQALAYVERVKKGKRWRKSVRSLRG